MATTALTPVQLVSGGFPATLDTVTFVAGDASLGNSFTLTGREIILVQNTHSTNPYNLVVTSAPDEFGRTGDKTYAIPALTTKAFKLARSGWAQLSGVDLGKVVLTVENAAVKLAVIRLPVA